MAENRRATAMGIEKFLPCRPRVVQAIRFILVGVVNTTFSYLIYAGLLFVGLSYQLANFLAVVVGILFSFKTMGHLVFRNNSNRLLGRFVLSWAAIYVCVIFLLGRIMALGFDAYAAGAMVLPFSAALSYLSQKYFVFRNAAVTETPTRPEQP